MMWLSRLLIAVFAIPIFMRRVMNGADRSTLLYPDMKLSGVSMPLGHPLQNIKLVILLVLDVSLTPAVIVRLVMKGWSSIVKMAGPEPIIQKIKNMAEGHKAGFPQALPLMKISLSVFLIIWIPPPPLRYFAQASPFIPPSNIGRLKRVKRLVSLALAVSDIWA